MIRKFLSSCAMVVALAAPAWAQEQCAAPAAPAIPDGAKAMQAQLVTAQNDLKAYATASDAFQACLARELVRQKDMAKQTNIEFDPGIQTALETKDAAQRKDVERVAAAWSAIVQAFTVVQQKKQRQAAPPSQSTIGGGYGGGGTY